MSTSSMATRRRFFWKAGAALAAPLAASGVARAGGHGGDAAAARMAALEDAEAIRALHTRLARAVAEGRRADLADLFVERSAVLDDHITRLAGDPLGEPATIEVSADGATASATLPCVVETETAIEGAGDTLIEMARAQGEGVLRRTERAVLETTCVKPGGTWKIVAARLRPA